MKPVFQTIVDLGRGNCLQAAVASLFELDLDQVPHFLKYPGGYFRQNMIYHFYWALGYARKEVIYPQSFHKLANKEGVRGVFIATVFSRTFPDVTHAVLIDHSGLVIHDPNPNKLWLWEDLSLSEELFFIDVIEKWDERRGNDGSK